MHRTLATLCTSVLVAVALAGCGSSGSGDAASKDESPPESTPATTKPAEPASVTHGPFCHDVDHTSADQVIGVTGQPVVTARKPGDKVKIFDTTRSVTGFECILAFGKGRDTVSYSMTVSGGPAGAQELAQRVGQLAVGKQGAVSCTKQDDEMLGEGGVRYSCTLVDKDSYSSGYPSTSYYGVTGDALLFCGANGRADLTPEQVEAAAGEICGSFLEAVATD